MLPCLLMGKQERKYEILEDYILYLRQWTLNRHKFCGTPLRPLYKSIFLLNELIPFWVCFNNIKLDLTVGRDLHCPIRKENGCGVSFYIFNYKIFFEFVLIINTIFHIFLSINYYTNIHYVSPFSHYYSIFLIHKYGHF